MRSNRWRFGMVIPQFLRVSGQPSCQEITYSRRYNAFPFCKRMGAVSEIKMTKLLRQLLPAGKSCACGHQKEYHLHGISRCVFGICDCQRYGHAIR